MPTSAPRAITLSTSTSVPVSTLLIEFEPIDLTDVEPTQRHSTSGSTSIPQLDTSLPIRFNRPPQIVEPTTGSETEDEELDSDGDYSDTASDDQEDWQEDLRDASGLDTSQIKACSPPHAL